MPSRDQLPAREIQSERGRAELIEVRAGIATKAQNKNAALLEAARGFLQEECYHGRDLKSMQNFVEDAFGYLGGDGFDVGG